VTEFDLHTMKGLRSLELATRLSISFAHHHYEQVLDFVPGEMHIYISQMDPDGFMYHGVICEPFTLKLEDGMLPFRLEVRFLDTTDGKRHWVARGNEWPFAYRCEDLGPGVESAEFDASAVKIGLEKATQNPWMPIDSGSPLDNAEDWEDLLRKAISGAFLTQRKFVERCRNALEFEALGDDVEISPEVSSLISNAKKKT
jgi:hypothetical protein